MRHDDISSWLEAIFCLNKTRFINYLVKMGSSNLDQNGKDDDNVSIAGTVFNEPWDSNVWENLLDLAHYGDEKPSTITNHHDMNQIVLG